LEQQQDDTSLVQTNAKGTDPGIIFVPPEDEPKQDLDLSLYHPVPLIGTQPPKERDIPQAPSSYKFAPRIITQKDLQPGIDLYGDDTTSDDKTSLVTTADSQDPTTSATDSTTESAVESSSNPTPASEPTPETDPFMPTTAPAESSTDESSTGSVDDYETDSSTGVADETENAEDAKHKFRNALDDNEIPKWDNVKDFVDEEKGLEFEKARDEASKIVEEELSKFKTEVLGVIMEQFSSLISGDGESEDDESDSRRGGWGGWGGDAEGEGEDYHEGYLDGEDDASHAPDDYDYEWEDNGPGNEAYDEDYDSEYDDQAAPAAHAGAAADTADEAGDDTVVDDATSASTSSSNSDKMMITALQAQIDQLKSDLEAARNGGGASSSTPTPTTTTPATPADLSATSAPAVSASAVVSSDGVAASAPVSVDNTGAVSTEPASTSGEPAVAGGDDEEVDTEEDGGDDYDDNGDDYDDDYGDDYDDYDYDYDDDGGEEWGHDHHGHWGRKYGGGGGWGRRGGGGNSYGGMSAPAVSAGGVRSYSQSGGQGGFVTTVNANTPKTITTVIGTTISPNGNGQSTITQNVERVQVDEYDEAVGTPGFNNAPGNTPIPVEPDGGIGSTPTPTDLPPAESTPAASATPATATPTTTPPTTAPATGVLTHGLTQQALAAVNAIRAQGEAILAPVHQPTGVDIKNLKALEDSSDVLTRAADEVAQLSAFREKRRLERLLG